MQFLRLAEVKRRTGLSAVTIWRYERAGKFPARRRLGPNVVAWTDDEVDSWMVSRPVVRAEESVVA
jgi:prophage regulatory protein